MLAKIDRILINVLRLYCGVFWIISRSPTLILCSVLCIFGLTFIINWLISTEAMIAYGFLLFIGVVVFLAFEDVVLKDKAQEGSSHESNN